MISTSSFNREMKSEPIISYVQRRLDAGEEFLFDTPLTIADVGCGDGSYTKNTLIPRIRKLFVDKQRPVHIEKYLIDPFGDKNKGILTLTEKEFATKIPNNYCDIITCFGCTHFFDDFPMFLNNCYGILKPGGILFIVKTSNTMVLPLGNKGQKAYEKVNSCSWCGRDFIKAANEQMNSKDGKVLEKLFGNSRIRVNKVSKTFDVPKQDWVNLIKHRQWSNFCLLNDQEIKESIDFVDSIYPNRTDNVKVPVDWFLTTIVKNIKVNNISKM